MHKKDWPFHVGPYSKLFLNDQSRPRLLTYGYDSSIWETTSTAGYEGAAKELMSVLEGTSSKVKSEGIAVFHTTGD